MNLRETNDSMMAAMREAQAAGAQVAAPIAPAGTGALTEGSVMREQLAAKGEKLGEFRAYDPQLTIPEIAGTRICKLLYQVSPKTGKKAAENSYVRLPTKHIEDAAIKEQLAALLPHITDWLAGLEDAQIREIHKKGQLNVFTEGLSIQKLIDVLESAGNGERLNKAKIGAWFEEYMQEGMENLVAAKMGITPEGIDAGTFGEQHLARLAAVVGAYRTKFESLAGGKTALPDADCRAMIDVIGKVEGAADSTLGGRFIDRLQKMMEKEKEEELLLML